MIGKEAMVEELQYASYSRKIQPARWMQMSDYGAV
jgi:hypothetical protein